MSPRLCHIRTRLYCPVVKGASDSAGLSKKAARVLAASASSTARGRRGQPCVDPGQPVPVSSRWHENGFGKVHVRLEEVLAHGPRLGCRADEVFVPVFVRATRVRFRARAPTSTFHNMGAKLGAPPRRKVEATPRRWWALHTRLRALRRTPLVDRATLRLLRVGLWQSLGAPP